MDITDKQVALVGLAVLTTGSRYLAVLLDEFFDLCVADNLTTELSDIIGQRLHDQVTVTFQAPTALDKTAVAMGKGEQGQRRLFQFHLQRRS